MSLSDFNRRMPAGRARGGTRVRYFGAWCGLVVLLCLADFWRRSPAVPEYLELEFKVPIAPDNDSEPLITTGVTGDGDFLYVKFLDAGTLQFGYDSWGAGGPLSAPLQVRPGSVLPMHIVMPAIAGPARHRDVPQLELRIPGRFAWTPDVHSHPCDPRTVEWGANRIGGSSSAVELTGVLRRPDGHIVTGTGLGRYYNLGERMLVWLRAVRWLVALYLVLGALGAAGAVRGIEWLALSVAGRNPAQAGAAERVAAVAGAAAGDYDAFAWLRALPARPFLSGFLVGFAGCVLAGFWAGRQPMFGGLVRFFHPVQPQSYFYPTVRELMAQIERTVPRDKVLVLVGGASYFRGTGQNPSNIWTRELQRRLGDRYAVVNYAIDQAGPPAFAAVVYQALAARYPKMVYVCSGGPFSEDPMDGGDVYRYLYWDAYYKGMFNFDAAWRERVERERERQLRMHSGRELHLGKRIDALTYACDLWTWIGYRYLFTVWSDGFPRQPFRARGSYVEGDDPNLAQQQASNRQNQELIKLLEERNLGFSHTGYEQNADGRWVLRGGTLRGIAAKYDRMLPPDVRAHALIVLVQANPYFMRSMTETDHQRVAEINGLAEHVIEELGYQAVRAGGDFSADDFIDAGHFMPSGGDKLAGIVAEKIVHMGL